MRPPCVKTSQRNGSEPGTRCASIATTMHCEPKRPAASSTSAGFCTAAVLMLTLSAPALSSRRTSATERTPPPTVSGMNTCSATASTTCTIGVAIVGTRRDVEERQLVGALLVVAAGDLHRIAGIAQADEVDALHHATGGDVETGNDAGGEAHGRIASATAARALSSWRRARRRASAPARSRACPRRSRGR